MNKSDSAKLFEALQGEMIINQSLIDILVEKGVLTHDELQAKINQIKIKNGILLPEEASNKSSESLN